MQKNLDEALSTYEQVLTMNPDNAYAKERIERIKKQKEQQKNQEQSKNDKDQKKIHRILKNKALPKRRATRKIKSRMASRKNKSNAVKIHKTTMKKIQKGKRANLIRAQRIQDSKAIKAKGIKNKIRAFHSRIKNPKIIPNRLTNKAKMNRKASKTDPARGLSTRSRDPTVTNSTAMSAKMIPNGIRSGANSLLMWGLAQRRRMIKRAHKRPHKVPQHDVSDEKDQQVQSIPENQLNAQERAGLEQVEEGDKRAYKRLLGRARAGGHLQPGQKELVVFSILLG